MQILIVTPEAARWTAFGEGLRAAGLSCSFAGAPDDLKAESLKADRPLLVLWDEPYTGDALRAAGIGVIMADARINQSACTDEGHETFHKKVEGLGFLPNVPLTRTAEDAALYYTIVEEILGKEWLTTELFRIGASSAANNILSAIEGSEVKYF